MSVLKAKRSESKAEYINTANNIYIETLSQKVQQPQKGLTPIKVVLLDIRLFCRTYRKF